MRVIQIVFAAVLVAGLACTTFAQETDAPRVPRFDESAGPKGYAPFIKESAQYLKQHPDSKDAPRVALDLIVVATVAGAQKPADDAKSLLLLRHGTTAAGRYVVTTFADPEAYRKFVGQYVNEFLYEPGTGTSGAGAKLIRVGLGRFGPRVLDEDELAVKAALLARDAEDAQLEAIALERARQIPADRPARHVADICFEGGRGGGEGHVVERITRLGEMGENRLAMLAQQFLLARLTPEQQAMPAMLRAAAQSRFLARDPERALESLEKLSKTNDATPADQYLRAACLAVLGKHEEAAKLLAPLKDAKAKGLADAAKGLADAARAAPAALDAHAAAVGKLVESLKAGGLGQIEASLTFKPDEAAGAAGGEPTTLYFVLANGPLFELHAGRGGKPLIAYRATGRRCRVFMAETGQTLEFAEGGPVPVPRLEIKRSPRGGFNLDFNFDTSRDPRPLETTSTTLLRSQPLIGGEETLRELLVSSMKRGSLPLIVPTPANQKDVQTLGWLSPSAREPWLAQWEFDVSPTTGKVLGLRGGGVTLDKLRYGLLGDFEPAPPAWPEAPVVAHERLDPTIFGRLMPTIFKLFAGGD